jgi:hypothetical protein
VTEPIAQRLKIYLKQMGFKIGIPEFETENESFFQSTSPATLLHMLEHFLQTSISSAQRRSRPQTLLPSFRGRFAAKRRKSLAESPEDAEILALRFHLDELEKWRTINFGNMFATFPSVGERFNNCRIHQLSLRTVNNGHHVPELSGNGSVHEVHGSLPAP